MLQYFKETLFSKDDYSNQNKTDNTDRIKIATCALFLEIANSDDELTDLELDKIYEILRTTFNLTDNEIQHLIILSEEQIKESVSLYEFTEAINKRFSEQEKYEIVKNLWRIVLADNKLDPYEEHLIKIINGNFRFYHKDLIAAKLEVKKELEDNN